MPDRYGVKNGYGHRPDPSYFDDDLRGVVWQPDVYTDAARIAEAVGAHTIIDIGSGDGSKLVTLHPRLRIIGIDFGPNVARSAERYPFGVWRHHDLDTADPLPVSDEELRDAVIVCSDVIEHLRLPELLLRKVEAALGPAPVLLLSTPERELWHGVRSAGPPRNVHHVREWSLRELEALLRAAGFAHVSMGLTRSNDRTEEANTIEALVTSRSELLDRLVPLLIDRPLPESRGGFLPRLIRAGRILKYG